MPSSLRESEDPDKWWRGNDLAVHYGKPGNQFTGRSLPSRNFQATFGALSGLLSRSGALKEHKALEWYEKPSARRVRLNSERHRRRFQENVS
jgi:hypothetical protein